MGPQYTVLDSSEYTDWFFTLVTDPYFRGPVANGNGAVAADAKFSAGDHIAAVSGSFHLSNLLNILSA